MKPLPQNPPELFEFPRIDRWLRRVSTAAVVVVALGLLGVGIALYSAPPATQLAPFTSTHSLLEGSTP